jgi:hypothetical protein
MTYRVMRMMATRDPVVPGSNPGGPIKTRLYGRGPASGAGYGLTDAVNGKLWPPLNITLPVTMVPGTPAAPTVAVQTAWAPTGMMP